jgi:O-antigen ligase
LFVCAITGLAAGIVNASDKELSLMTYLQLCIPLAAVYIASRIHPKIDPEDFKGFSIFVSIAVLLVAGYGLFEVLTRSSPLYEHLIGNPYHSWYITSKPVCPLSTQFHVGPLASFLVVCLPFQFFSFEQGKSLLLKIFALITILVSGVVLFLTYSRGGFVAYTVVALAWMALRGHYKLIFIFCILVAAALYFFSYAPLPFKRLSWEWMFGEVGKLSLPNQVRYRVTARIIYAHPLCGIGFRNFWSVFERYSALGLTRYGNVPDNMYLCLIAETGIIGFYGVMVFLAAVLYRAIKVATVNIRHCRSLTPIMTVVLALCGILINMVSYDYFYWANQYLLLCIIIGLAVNLTDAACKEEGSRTE